MVKIVSFNVWLDRWIEDLQEAYDNSDTTGLTFDAFARGHYATWKESAQESNLP